MTTTIEATRTPTPVKVVFRASKKQGASAITGSLADLVRQMSNLQAKDTTGNAVNTKEGGLFAILPYHPLPAGQKTDDMVAVLMPDGSREVKHWPSIIKDSVDAEPDAYASFMADMEDNGYEVEPITARQVNALLRRAERPVVSAERQADEDTFEVEDIYLEGSITGDLDSSFSSTFTEDWA